MKKNIRSLAQISAAGVGLMASLNPSHSQEFYFNAGAGVSLADDVDLKRFFGPTGGAKMEFDPGVRFSVGGGYNFCPYMGIEAETGFIYNSVKGVNSFGNFDGSLSHVPMMINAVFRYDQPDCKWVPYAGAGLGGDTSVIGLENAVGNGVIADGSEATVVFAWQAFAGVGYRFNERMSLGAGYKYYWADSATWDFAGFTDSIKSGRASVHSIQAVFTMKF